MATTKRARGDTQQRILDYIKSETEVKGYAPSVREICDAVQLKSTSTVHGHLKRLEKKGMLHRDPMKPRAMDVSGSRERVSNGKLIPIVGKVAAGSPILAEELIEEYVPLPNAMLENGVCFILEVRGESMITAGILDGDCVVVHKQETANNGDIVVAMIDGDATVKRFFKEDGHIRLQPENPTMQPIIVKNVQIVGKVVSVYRVL